MWILLSISGITIAYILLFTNIPFIIRLIVVYAAGVILLSLIVVGLISAAVNKKTDVTYKLLNTYIARHIPRSMAYNRRVLNRWVFPVFMTGWRKNGLDVDDLFRCSRHDESQRIVRELE
ncbi:unnamed protein product, partial [Oppiella nova]